MFEAHPAIACIVLVAGADELDRVRAFAREQNLSKLVAVVAGGETRADSVKQGLDALPEDIALVLVHDAARPLLSAGLIDRIIEATARVGAAVPGLPLSDTVKRVDSNGIVRATIPRSATIEGELLSGLTAVQTPQGARVELLRAAYAHWQSLPDAGESTDEASLLEALGVPVAVVPGDAFNLKITRQEDIELAERFHPAPISLPPHPAPDAKVLSSLSGERQGNVLVTQQTSGFDTNAISPGEIRTGLGYDVHAFAAPEAGRKLFLGGVEIPHAQGLDGHSDADVLLHAVCDALLGAASLGDIGILFPNTDPAYKGISSLRLLAIVGERLSGAGWQIVNIDATVVAEAPKLMPYREAIHKTMADCLNLAPGRVSVKATTNEKMGFLGRQEGIAAWAIATVRARVY